MDYGRPSLVDRLAAEHVLGTLRGPARRRFESLLPAHPALRAAVAAWQTRLIPLSAAVTPVPPSARVWSRVEHRLFDGTAAPLRWWHKLGLWQGVSGFATVAALAFGLVLSQPRPVEPPIVLVIAPNPEAAGVLQAGFAAGLTRDGRALVLQPIHEVAPGAGRAFELWAVPPQGAPRSLGLVSGERPTTVQRALLLKDTAAFAVSLEPSGGSPTGAPTGPILSVGKLGI